MPQHVSSRSPEARVMGCLARKLCRAARILRSPFAPPPPEPRDTPPAKSPRNEAEAFLTKMADREGWQVVNASGNLGVAPCNHTCIFCPQSIQKPKKARWLDLELLRKVLSEMPED